MIRAMRKIVQVASFGLLAVACTSATFPKVVDVATTIVQDIAKGDTEQQIASDVCADLGGTALTDAVCGDVATVIAGIIPILLQDPKVSADVKSKLLPMKAHLASGTFGK